MSIFNQKLILLFGLVGFFHMAAMVNGVHAEGPAEARPSPAVEESRGLANPTVESEEDDDDEKDNLQFTSDEQDALRDIAKMGEELKDVLSSPHPSFERIFEIQRAFAIRMKAVNSDLDEIYKRKHRGKKLFMIEAATMGGSWFVANRGHAIVRQFLIDHIDKLNPKIYVFVQDHYDAMIPFIAWLTSKGISKLISWTGQKLRNRKKDALLAVAFNTLFDPSIAAQYPFPDKLKDRKALDLAIRNQDLRSMRDYEGAVRSPSVKKYAVVCRRNIIQMGLQKRFANGLVQ